jgi:peptidoglycan hydrolase CwlO-like protein
MRIRHGRRVLVHATIALVACFGSSGAVALVHARPVADTGTRLSTARQELQAVLTDLRTTTSIRDRLGRQLGTLLRRIDVNRRRIESVTAQLVDAEIHEEGTQAEVDAQQRLVDERAADAYTDPVNPIDVLLAATSLSDLQSRQAFLGAIARSDQLVVAGLSARRRALAQVVGQAESLQQDLDRSRSSLQDQAAMLSTQLVQQQQAAARLDADAARARSLVRKLHDRLAREEAERALAAAANPTVPPPPANTEDVRRLIRREFGPQGQTRVDQALCVGYHESRYNPDAVNASSGAAGVFQFMPETWGSMSAAAGYQGDSVFDAGANVTVAAWTVAHYGWSPWTLDGPYCGF